MSETTGTSLQVRPIQKSDDAPLAKLIRQVMTEFGLDREGTGFQDPDLDHLSQTYAGENALFLTVLLDGEVLGGGGFAPMPHEEPGTCELQRMYFSPSLRGRGVGVQILKNLLDSAKNTGYATCYLETMSGMDRARKLYEGFGFQKSAKRRSGNCGCNAYYSLDLTTLPNTPTS